MKLRSETVGGVGGRRERHLVTGGGGYVGLQLGEALSTLGHDVILFDVCDPPEDLPENCTFVKGDIRQADDVRRVISDVDCVYHLASYGMSGREQLNRKLIEEVNIGGTRTVLELCKEFSIQRLVYTSTFNVVYGGQTIKNGDESLPYLPIEKHPDWYSRTKMLAEQQVLAADGNQLQQGTKLHTCALRLAGVYGPGERRHLPRIVGYIEKGLFAMTYGDADNLVEFLHVDNLVQAHVKAAQHLLPGTGVAAGQAYFISDCKPINNFEFFRPLVEGLGYTYPTIRLPLSLIYFVAFLTEWIHAIVGPFYNFQPLLTRTEVYKTGVTHYFSNDKARRELGYEPTVQNDMGPVVDWFKERGHVRPRRKPSRLMSLLVDLILVVVFVAVVLSFLPFVQTLGEKNFL